MESTDRICVEGVAGFGPGEYASSVHGCQARILQTLGEARTYDDLVCFGGFAFRIGVHAELCPSAGHPCCGYLCVAGSERALPWTTRAYDAPPAPADRAAFEAEAGAAVRDSIARGIPVHYCREEDGLIVGCTSDGQRWWCLHPYHRGGAEPFWHDEVDGFAGGRWPWRLVVWTGPKPRDERSDDGELTRAALRQAVDMWTAAPHGAYHVGDGAYRHWLSWLHAVDAGGVDDPKAGMQGNGWCFDVLAHSRHIAGRWLRQRAVDPAHAAAGDDLRVAADHYTAIADLCLRDLSCPWDLAPGPQRADDWTAAMRREQVARLEAARAHDDAAVAALDRALGRGA